MHPNIEIALIKTQSRAFRTSDWAEDLPSNRTMNLNTQQEWLIHNSVNVLEWPSQSLSLNPIKYFWRNMKMSAPSNMTDLERWGGEWQIIAKCWWWSKFVVSYPKKTWGCNWVKAANIMYIWTLCKNKLNTFSKFSNTLLSYCHYGVLFVEFWGK